MSESSLIIPSAIEWESLKSDRLEEFLYWLLDDMNAVELNWRKGGRGSGAPDGGRDLEATFQIPSPDGGIISEKWWVECKGTTRTVGRQTVLNAVQNCAGLSDVDVLLVVTNSMFSNSTRDHLKKWQAANPRPRVVLWDRTKLEGLACRHPSASLRLFNEAATLQGKLEIVSERVLHRFQVPSNTELEDFWTSRSELEWTPWHRLVVLLGEVANGELASRTWTFTWDEVEVSDVTSLFLENLIPFILRVTRFGGDQETIFGVGTQLIVASLLRIGTGRTIEILLEPLMDGKDSNLKELYASLLGQALARMQMELLRNCSEDCIRVSILSSDESDYWHRLSKKRKLPREGYLVLEHTATECKIGLSMDDAIGCPVREDFDLAQGIEGIVPILEKIEKLLRARQSLLE